MKILLLHEYFSYLGGEDIYHDSLKRLFKSYGHKVIEFTKNNKDIGKNIFSRILVSQKTYWNKEVYSKLTEIILSEKPEIAHFNNIFPLITPIAYRVCAKLKIPVVQTFHDYRYICPSGQLFRNGKSCSLCLGKKLCFYSMLYGCYHNSRLASVVFATSLFFHKIIRSFGYIDKFIFPSNFSRKYFLKYSDILPEKTVVVPYFTQIEKDRKNHSVKKDYFLFVGRLSEEKGIKELLNVFSSLPYMKLMVIGDGPLKKQVHKYKVYKNIIFKNFLPQEKIFNYMKNSIATIIPSLFYETGPIVMIESFASGTPVIVPNFGSFIEAVNDGKTGLFYRQYDFADLKAKIFYAYENRSSMRKMGIAARSEYETKYTPRLHYQALIKVYKSVIKSC